MTDNEEFLIRVIDTKPSGVEISLSTRDAIAGFPYHGLPPTVARDMLRVRERIKAEVERVSKKRGGLKMNLRTAKLIKKISIKVMEDYERLLLFSPPVKFHFTLAARAGEGFKIEVFSMGAGRS